jgi:hypothetical protein
MSRRALDGLTQKERPWFPSRKGPAGRAPRAAGIGPRLAPWSRIATLTAVVLSWSLLAALPLHAQCTSDLQGADDEPGQKDLTQFCLVGTCNVSDTSISWAFDDTSWSGNNTGDACALFDTDGDGNANRAVCVTVEDGAQMQAGNPKCYTCGNTRPDRCTNSVLVACTSTCQVTLDPDPFALDPNHVGNACSSTGGCPGSATCCRTKDANVTCCLTAGDLGGGILIDACSYPSQQPNSDPSDCVENRSCSKNDPNDPACDDLNPCTVDSCDTTFGVCRHVAGNQGAQCRAATGICDAAEFCTGSSINCPPDEFAQGGICRNANGLCDVPESCDGTSADCPPDQFAQGGVCRSATGVCDVAESCDGTSPDCPPDGSQPSNTPCDDNNACTTGDVCDGAGSCVGGAPPDCNDNNICTDDGCDPASGCTHVNNTDPCNDGNACTTNDHCSGGACAGGPPPNCNDNNECTDDGCDPGSGCTHANNTDPCSDGDACTVDDHCSGGACAPGSPADCNDQNVCTTDGCDPASGCTHGEVPDCCNLDSDCADSDQCTTNERCVDHGCVSDPVDCNDQNACTDDGCDPASGCTHVDNADPCNDGNACTDGDTCSSGSCVGGPIDCNDNNICTDDGCDPASGCTHANNTDPCSDGSECTTNDQCSGGACVGGPPPNCDDNNVCTTDGCDPGTLGGCTHANNTDPCDDGNGCTEGDHCSGGACAAGSPKDCSDQNLCTDDSCSAPSGTCEHLNNAEPCDDGNVCTEGDICGGGTCQPGGPKDCNDGFICTNDFCTPTTGCQHSDPQEGCCESSDEECADTDHCTTNERCVDHTCVSDPVDCDDQNNCTVDICTNAGGGFLCENKPCYEIDPNTCPGGPDGPCIPIPCGNGELDPGETCDPPDPTPIPGVDPPQPKCRQDCTFCGDGILQGMDGEACDDGNNVGGCRTHNSFPIDDCQTNCTPPICRDPSKALLASSIDRFKFHGRLTTTSPVDFSSRSFVLELTDPTRKVVIFRASLPKGAVVSKSGKPDGPFKFASKDAKRTGGLSKVKIKSQRGAYRASVVAYGNLLGSRTDMETRIRAGSAQWTVRGEWQLKGRVWKLIEK